MSVYNSTPAASASIQDLPCEVVIPAQLREKLFREGISPSSNSEHRRFARFNCGRENRRIGVRYLSSLPALKRNTNWRGAILVDVSRGGMQFLNAELLYPSEKARFAWEAGGTMQVVEGEVAWCRRLGELCFGVGIRFLQSV